MTAVQRTSQGAVIGALELRRDIQRAYWHGNQVDLTFGQFAIVYHMAIQPGRDMTYRQIYDVVRGKDFAAGSGPDGFRANVRSAIKRIRQKFRDVDPGFDRIENYSSFGYRWRAGPYIYQPVGRHTIPVTRVPLDTMEGEPDPYPL